ncbi:MAG: ABC transporter substrate-binding protein [Phycisphaeraceae bacterium]|nr:ABC transporter substrate-binding protein [Phycisphaeraceae bacterium]
MTDGRMPIHLAHSPDPDDAFMWWPICGLDDAPPVIDTGRWRFRAVTADIETLNRRSEDGTYEITAMSCAQYPHVSGAYAITACGASMGSGYGPRIVARRPMSADALRAPDCVIAVPGVRTSAFGALSLLLGAGRFRFAECPFAGIPDRVAAGEFGAGVVIHEAQLTFPGLGLVEVADLGRWWSDEGAENASAGPSAALPLPLGINAIRRDLEHRYGRGTLREITGLLHRSVQHAMAHRETGLRHARRFAITGGPETTDAFVDMYVNGWTLDFGDAGRRAIRRFLGALAGAGLVPSCADPAFVEAPAP